MKIPFVSEGVGRDGQGLIAFALQNLYPALEGGASQGFARQGPALVQTPGSSAWGSLGADPVRGLFYYPDVAGSLAYGVGGTDLYSLTSSASATNLGSISGTDPVMFDMVRGYVLICADGKVWTTTGGAPTQITDVDLGTITAIASLDGRMIAARDGNDTFVYSDVLAPDTIESLSFATAEAYGDNLVRPVVFQRNLFLLGKRSAEIWGSTGSGTAPFARIGGAVEPYGLAAKHSVAQQGPLLFFVAVAAQDDVPCIAMMTPSFTRLSDAGMEARLARLTPTELAAVRGHAFRIGGATFYQVDLAGEGSWACHIESSTWLRRRKGSDTLWHSACYASAFGLGLVGSRTDGTIYALDPTRSTDAGDTLSRVATTYLPADRPTPIETLFIDAGVRSASGAATASVALSHDDGESWSTARNVTLSKSGARAGLSHGWGRIRRPGALLSAAIDGNFIVALYNAIINEAAT